MFTLITRRGENNLWVRRWVELGFNGGEEERSKIKAFQWDQSRDELEQQHVNCSLSWRPTLLFNKIFRSNQINEIHRIGVWSECFQFRFGAVLSLPPNDVYSQPATHCRWWNVNKKESFFSLINFHKYFSVISESELKSLEEENFSLMNFLLRLKLNYEKKFVFAFIAFHSVLLSGSNARLAILRRSRKPVCVQNESNKVVVSSFSVLCTCFILYYLYAPFVFSSNG